MRPRAVPGAMALVASLGGLLAGAPAPQSQWAAAIEVRPSSLVLRVGEKAQLTAVVKDNVGKVLSNARVIFFSRSADAVGVTATGEVVAYRPGQYEITALSPTVSFEGDPDSYSRNDPGLRATVTVTVPPPPLARLEITAMSANLYAGTTVMAEAVAFDTSGARRGDVRASFTVSDERVVTVDPVGQLTALRPGTATLSAAAEGVTARLELRVVENPVRSLTVRTSRVEARTGDVVHFEAAARDASGREVDDVPVSYVLQAWPDPDRPESVGAGAPAQLAGDGRFVAEQPGIYTVMAIAGGRVARESVRVGPRDVAQDVEFVGHARVDDRITSDLWIWEGVDGRDYAVHGTWNAEGHAYFYDVTDPANMELIDTVQVDARTVNDVKVSEDGRIGVISREGASNRRNGIVILDVSNPRDVKILSTFDDQLTGGVHNVFVYEDHVYAVNNGRRWDVINIEDPTRPTRVGRFETSTPGRSVHDVWVRDGIAYQAGRTDGAIMVDVGGGGKGGSPSNPVEMGRLHQLTGWNHSAWPFRSKSAGKFYFVAGDEAFYRNPRVPAGISNWQAGLPSRARGWVHFLDFDDPANPREVARYEVPESGPHNYWVDWEQEILYVAQFNGGLRVVDISGELMGDLYRQGREIAKFYPDDPEGFMPNAPFLWGPQPYKGHIFFADHATGLWAVRLVPPDREAAVGPVEGRQQGEEWSRFRGPNGTGVAQAVGLPVEFGPDKNVLWKTALPPGHSSPVLTADHIFLTAIEGEALLTLCLDRATGEILWRREAPRDRAEELDPRNNPASPSPVTDGTSVFAFFPDFGLIAYDVDGNEKWRMRLGPFKNIYGMGASPVLVDDKVILVCDHNVGSFIIAVGKEDGRVRWRTERPEAKSGHSTPVVYRPPAGPTQVVVAGSFFLTGYSADSGEKLWWVRGLIFEMKSTPVVRDGVAYINGYGFPMNQPGSQVVVPPFEEVLLRHDTDANGVLEEPELPDERTRSWLTFLDLDGDRRMNFDEWSYYQAAMASTNGILAIRLGGEGDMTDENVVWQYHRAVPQLPSPLLYEGVLYMVNDGGIVTSLDPATGRAIAQGRLRGAVEAYFASPVAADGKIYFVSELGKVAVLEPGGSLEVVAVNDLDDLCYATPAIADGRIYVRTRGALYAFGRPMGPVGAR